MTNIDEFNDSLRQFVKSMETYEPDPDERAFSDADPDTWLSAPVERDVQQLPVCFEHEAVIDVNGVTTCARCGASAEEIIAEHEAQFEAAIVLGTYPDFETDTDDGPDSERDDYARSAWVVDDAEDF